ncbi:hypothetical protein A6U85_27965 [Agrobacterium sp. 13-626]|nr:hypothetical protein A6U85_27965 [Agrobacterium sp. 13-626]
MWFLERLSALAEVICNEIYRITPKIGIDFPAVRTSSLHSITDGRQQSPPWKSRGFLGRPVDSAGIVCGKSDSHNDHGLDHLPRELGSARMVGNRSLGLGSVETSVVVAWGLQRGIRGGDR